MAEKPKKINIAFNGFGRIGRNLVRKLISDNRYNIVAINARTTVDVRAHLFKYDSVYGRYPGDISYELDNLIIDGHTIPNFDRKTPAKLPWDELEVDFVIESTGKFTNKHDLEQHIEAGAKNVIVTSPAKDVDATLVFGVNETSYKVQENNIISASSCTTTCLTPILKVLMKNFGIKQGTMTTVHSYTMGQALLDSSHPDLRRARAATMSIIPTTTGAAKAVTKIFPHLKNDMGGAGFRVPVPDGSLTDLTCTLRNSTSVDEINDVFKTASETFMNGILEYTNDPIVSVDVIGNTHSAVFDANLTAVLGDKNKLIKVVAWYDNEMGYSSRLVELIEKFA